MKYYLHVGYKIALTPEFSTFLLSTDNVTEGDLSYVIDPYFAVHFYRDSHGGSALPVSDPQQSSMRSWLKANKEPTLIPVKRVLINRKGKRHRYPRVVLELQIKNKLNYCTLLDDTGARPFDVKTTARRNQMDICFDVPKGITVIGTPYGEAVSRPGDRDPRNSWRGF